MRPTFEQTQKAAYQRWQARGGAHGLDRDDWLAAEQELAFAQSYQIIARHPLTGPARRILGDAAHPRCRFCEQTAPAAAFARPMPIGPAWLAGSPALFTVEVCDDCRNQFEDQLFPEFERFAHPLVREFSPSPPSLSIAAFKALTALGLMILPARELEHVEDALEWVANPDHELDASAIGELECTVYTLSEPSAPAWASLARRVDDDAPTPYLLVALGAGRAAFVAPLPLCVCDDDLDGAEPAALEASLSALSGRPIASIASTRLRVASAAPPKRALLPRMFPAS